jgi:hypothetical protein
LQVPAVALAPCFLFFVTSPEGLAMPRELPELWSLLEFPLELVFPPELVRQTVQP